jgi:endo-1,4-beta-xylanase
METALGAPAEEIEKDPAKYGYSSAMTEVAGVRAPILIINGRNDDNSPTSVIDAYVTRLRAAGKQVETYLPENGPHGFYFGHPDIPESKEAARLAVGFFRKRFARAVVPAAAPTPAHKTKYLYGGGVMDWVDSDHSDAGDLKFKIFHSAKINADVSYMIWFPPDYEQERDARYPVLYELPASGGTPRRNTPNIVNRVEKAIRDHRISPMIIVGVPSLRGNTMYCDSRDGEFPLETVIIQDLIPHLDATYRTVASREGRAVDGFSMGGFGAAHLGLKFPEVFGVVSIMAPPLLGPELKQPLPARAWSNLFTTAMLNDLDYFRANDPFSLAGKNADALRDRTYIRIVAHSEDEHWLMPQCEKLHQILLQQEIPHEFCVFANVKGHSPNGCLDSLGDAAFSFFSSSLPRSQGR